MNDVPDSPDEDSIVESVIAALDAPVLDPTRQGELAFGEAHSEQLL
ncbi:hypothetical protein AB4Y32_39345 [Paraburkholderia phymatum]|uniref:Uncharacterized protein n=1 Tax=Paraburkholderia phymatum TaxID=148447 RepID=A0ACC6UDT6_9BURK